MGLPAEAPPHSVTGLRRHDGHHSPIADPGCACRVDPQGQEVRGGGGRPCSSTGHQASPLRVDRARDPSGGEPVPRPSKTAGAVSRCPRHRSARAASASPEVLASSSPAPPIVIGSAYGQRMLDQRPPCHRYPTSRPGSPFCGSCWPTTRLGVPPGRRVSQGASANTARALRTGDPCRRQPGQQWRTYRGARARRSPGDRVQGGDPAER